MEDESKADKFKGVDWWAALANRYASSLDTMTFTEQIRDELVLRFQDHVLASIVGPNSATGGDGLLSLVAPREYAVLLQERENDARERAERLKAKESAAPIVKSGGRS